jgi:hypothetical protein
MNPKILHPGLEAFLSITLVIVSLVVIGYTIKLIIRDIRWKWMTRRVAVSYSIDIIMSLMWLAFGIYDIYQRFFWR